MLWLFSCNFCASVFTPFNESWELINVKLHRVFARIKWNNFNVLIKVFVAFKRKELPWKYLFFFMIWHGLRWNTMHQQIPKMLRGYFLPGSIKICLPHRKLIINCHSYIRGCWWSSWLQNERSHRKCSLSHSPQSVKMRLSTNPNLKYIKDSSHVSICFYSPSTLTFTAEEMCSCRIGIWD